ncbi:MAG: FAD-dependent oxidoreductase [bacterium]|nr:FAD-dependent oxidoreductase [bacterium]
MKSQVFTVEIPDIGYWKKQVKCQDACPVHTDSRAYVRAIADGDYEKAYLVARGPNPLASICGRICGAPCEAACRRTDIDEAVSIRALKRFVTERFGAESGAFQQDFLAKIKRLFRLPRHNEGAETIGNIAGYFGDKSLTIPEDAPTVGIIGSGPAGLAAAHDLCLMGIKPVIYEMEPVPAGMLYLGVPAYRLPRGLIAAEVEVIKNMGTDIRCNVQVGKDISFSELRKQHDAVLIAVGAKKSRSIPIPNIDAPGVVGGIDFLRDVALNEDVQLGRKVLVIGGGNVAYDVARTLVRQTEYDVSRTALRQKGVQEVHLVCLESLEEMPADTVEIEEGREEGVVRHNSWGPKEIMVDEKGNALGVRFTRCLSVFDENKRFAPRFDENEVMELTADNIFLSIGQAVDLGFIDSKDVTLDQRGLLKLDSTRTCTGAPDVFSAGDVALGPGLMIDAIANGKTAARKIFNYVRGSRAADKKEEARPADMVSHSEVRDYHREIGYESIPREGVPAISPEERRKSMHLSVEKGFDETQSRRQGDRCLDCSINTIFDGEKCILCGGCADVCPEGCLKLVSTDRLKGNADFDKLVENYYNGVPPSEGGAIIKDETRCIRCGLCAQRCPVDAITMESFYFQEVFK